MTDNLIQGSPEWHDARRGKITSTGFSKVLSKRGNTRKDYMRQLVLERKTGVTIEPYKNEAMEWGTLCEPQARAYYEKDWETTNTWEATVGIVGFVEHDGIDFKRYVGVSPDGLCGNIGCIEIKCPNSSTHLEYIAKNVLPSKYKAQVQGILWVTDSQWCDFISFDPRVVKQPYWCIRIVRDEEYINNLIKETALFIDEMIKMKEEIKDVDPQTLIDVTEGGCSEEDLFNRRVDDIRGRCLHGYIVAQIKNGTSPKAILEPENKTDLLALYKFSLTGE